MPDKTRLPSVEPCPAQCSSEPDRIRSRILRNLRRLTAHTAHIFVAHHARDQLLLLATLGLELKEEKSTRVTRSFKDFKEQSGWVWMSLDESGSPAPSWSALACPFASVLAWRGQWTVPIHHQFHHPEHSVSSTSAVFGFSDSFNSLASLISTFSEAWTTSKGCTTSTRSGRPSSFSSPWNSILVWCHKRSWRKFTVWRCFKSSFAAAAFVFAAALECSTNQNAPHWALQALGADGFGSALAFPFDQNGE